MNGRGREAYVIVCDDIRTEASGKMIIIGAYTGDIAIFADSDSSPQLTFYFRAECDVDDPFAFIRFEVTLPGEEPAVFEAALPPPPPMPLERRRAYVRHIMRIAPATLRPGKIVAKVVHEKGEIPLSSGWISKVPADGPIS